MPDPNFILKCRSLKGYLLIAGFVTFSSCTSSLVKCGKHYQKHKDFQSLQCVVKQLPEKADSQYVRTILGAPIDMGFDFRYLIDSTGENGCVIGAVFHIDENGSIDQRWIDEICE